MKQRQIHNFNKTTFIIYTSITFWLFPQSLQYRIKALVKTFFILPYVSTHASMKWSDIWLKFQQSKGFSRWSSDVHQKTPTEAKTAHQHHLRSSVTDLLPSCRFLGNKKTEYMWFSQSSIANSSVNMRYDITLCNIRDGLYFKELIRIYWLKNTEQNDNDF